jgi:hypothetical protein
MKDVSKFMPWCTPIIKYGLMALVAVGAISLSMSHYELQSADPLQNLSANLLGQVHVDSGSIIVHGTYDREVSCTLTDFTVELRSQDDANMSIMLGPRHLLKGPKPDNGPGVDLPIRFHLQLPKGALTVGTWKPTFSGQYHCQKGIFRDTKIIVVIGDSFEVRPALEEPVIILDDELKIA